MNNYYATHKRAGENWNVSHPDGSIQWEQVPIAVLMDIRAELQKLNAVLACQDFVDVPGLLRAIKKNTAKPKRKAAKKS